MDSYRAKNVVHDDILFFFLTNLLNVMLCYDIHLEKSSSCFCVLVNIFFYMLHFIN